MILSERLQQLRRQNGLSQERLAEALNVARQTISKWENGQAEPELAALVRMSDLYGVSLDRMVKGEDGCALKLSPQADAAQEELITFLLQAKRSTYAAKAAEAKPSRLASHDFVYAQAPWRYMDTYVGGECFAGEEVVWHDGAPVWSMNYAGRVLADGFSGDFLKEALLRGTWEMPWRGPALHAKGEYTYHCRADGVMDWFAGEEEILLRGHRIYECRFHGGKIG